MMTMTSTRHAVATVGGVLANIHEGWMHQVTTFLGPVLDEDASIWTRWSGVRFLSDQLGDRFRLECALLEALGELMPEETRAGLVGATGAIQRTREELMAVGRRRATRQLTARLARRLIDQLALWCVEVEFATAAIPVPELPPDACSLLAHLGVADTVGR